MTAEKIIVGMAAGNPGAHAAVHVGAMAKATFQWLYMFIPVVNDNTIL